MLNQTLLMKLSVEHTLSEKFHTWLPLFISEVAPEPANNPEELHLEVPLHV